MNRPRPCGFAALAALSAFVVILLVAGWGSVGGPGTIVFASSGSANPMSGVTAGRPAAILAGLAVAAVLLYRARAAWRHINIPAVRQLLAQEPASHSGRTYDVPGCPDSDIISSGGTSIAKYAGMCLTMLDRLICLWPLGAGVPSARTRRCTVGAVVCGAVILIVTLGTVHPGESADSGIAGCAALLGAHQVAAADYPGIRSQFAGSRWPDLRTAGTSYADLVVTLVKARNTDGYETVWFYQRLSIACAGHGRNITSGR
jgi:hypothetical protein